MWVPYIRLFYYLFFHLIRFGGWRTAELAQPQANISRRRWPPTQRRLESRPPPATAVACPRLSLASQGCPPAPLPARSRPPPVPAVCLPGRHRGRPPARRPSSSPRAPSARAHCGRRLPAPIVHSPRPPPRARRGSRCRCYTMGARRRGDVGEERPTKRIFS